MSQKAAIVESRIKLLGHPVHPMLIVFPLGLLSVGVLLDILYLLTGDEILARVAFWDIGLGVLGGLAAAVFGLVDWLAITSGTRAKRLGLLHGAGNVVIVVLFAVSWWLRLPDPAYAPDLLPFFLGLIGVVLALGTAWLGGELVYRLRIGVDTDAHPDASSSLGQGVISTGRRDEIAAESGVVPKDPP